MTPALIRLYLRPRRTIGVAVVQLWAGFAIGSGVWFVLAVLSAAVRAVIG